MKAIVIYETKYGFTKEVAEFINHEVAEAEIISIDDVASINIKKYDRIFVCGNINYGEVSQKTTAFLKKNKSTLMYKNVISLSDKSIRFSVEARISLTQGSHQPAQKLI